MHVVTRTPRAEQIVACARTLIEQGEGDRLTMRRLGDELGIQAPSLYKHFADKQAITTAVHVDYLRGQVEALTGALAASGGHPLERVTYAFRDYAIANAELYRFLFGLPYPRTEAAEVLKRLRVQLAQGCRRLGPRRRCVRLRPRHGRHGAALAVPGARRACRRLRRRPRRPRGPGRFPHSELSQSARISSRCSSGRGAGPRTPDSRLLKRYGDRTTRVPSGSETNVPRCCVVGDSSASLV